MKIIFVTGSLEPGRNGVGDYCRRLAAACVRAGHSAALLALTEPRPLVDPAAEMEVEGTLLPALRLTDAAWRTEAGVRAGAWLAQQQPDWVSLQFVPYGFHPRGLFASSIPLLAATLQPGSFAQHVFFHEIWIGSYRSAPWRTRLIGWWQRVAVRRLLRRLQPRLVHTSNTYYTAALDHLGIAAKVLPMFGNVPSRVPEEAPSLPGIGHEDLVCGMFGTLHPNWESADFLGDFANLAVTQGRPAVFATVGSLGCGEADFDRLAASWAAKIRFIRFGRLGEADLSRVFARFDFAATTVPWNILGKSGSVAALREHGLRVVVTAAGAPPRFGAVRPDDATRDPGCVPYWRDRALLPAVFAKTSPRWGVETVAESFLAGLSEDYPI